MSTLQLARPRAKSGHRFYLIMSIVLAAIAIFGFAHTVPGDFVPPGLPLLLQLHAAVFTAWVLLFVTQPILVARRSIALHRKLGWAGAGLACCMVALGGYAILFALWADAVPFFYPHGLFLVRGLFALLMFAGLVLAGVLQRRRPEWHRRLMLCASIVVIVPGLERSLPLPLFGANWPFVADGVTDLLVLAGPARDLITRGSVHPAYVWAVCAIVLGQAIVDIVSPSPLATMMLHAVGAH